MNEISLDSVGFILGIFLVAGLRVYAGWACIPKSVPKAYGTCGRCRRARPTGQLPDRSQLVLHETDAEAFGRGRAGP